MTKMSKKDSSFHRILDEQLKEMFLIEMSLKCSADPLERPRNRWPNFDEIVDFSFVFRFESVDERDSANIHCISLNFSRLYYTRILDPKTIDEGLFERVTSPQWFERKPCRNCSSPLS